MDRTPVCKVGDEEIGEALEHGLDVQRLAQHAADFRPQPVKLHQPVLSRDVSENADGKLNPVTRVPDRGCLHDRPAILV